MMVPFGTVFINPFPFKKINTPHTYNDGWIHVSLQFIYNDGWGTIVINDLLITTHRITTVRRPSLYAPF